MQFIGIIPARFASTRFPGKPLVEIEGKSMIHRVYDQAVLAGCFSSVVVATDDERIFDHVERFGNVVYTSPKHPSGTDRCFEAALGLEKKWNIKPNDVIVNIQGDEPFIHPSQIREICQCFQHEEVNIATLIRKINDTEVLFNENVVKVVVDKNGKALYFSRSPIPFFRGKEKDEWVSSADYYKHIGMYAYRYKVLGEITRLKGAFLENTESLEQLRWLENGVQIHTRITALESHAVDNPEDLNHFK
ncbi:MAG: 3-deoxy-manno-octulosonate cytidylyltransferase [Bacteroidetes bacterium]|nr:MAG: 3-deoxy-manno-octulosonate cytidylyltransferase [Bacteroidota bacterium]